MDDYIKTYEPETYDNIYGWSGIELRQILECVYDMFRCNYTWDDISSKLMYECNDEMSYLLLNINEFNKEYELENEINLNYDIKNMYELKCVIYTQSLEAYMERFLRPDILKICKKLMEKKVKNIFEKYITHLNNIKNKKKTINKIIINTTLPIELVNKISEICV
jgi:hypothetical protein